MPRRSKGLIVVVLLSFLLFAGCVKERKSNEEVKLNLHHILASENMVRLTSLKLSQKFLDELLLLKPYSVSFNIYLENYRKKERYYSHLFNLLKESKAKLVVVYMVGKGRIRSKREYLERELEFVDEVVCRHKPDYFGILVEPTTMQKRCGLSLSLNEWIEIINAVNERVKRCSPETKTFISLLVEEAKEGLATIARKTNVDVIGVNIWNERQLEKVRSLHFAEVIRKSGKTPWIWMNWLENQGSEDFRSCKNQLKAIEWFDKVYDVALEEGFELVSPFFTEQLFYCEYENKKGDLFESVEAGRKTPLFFHIYNLTHDFERVEGDIKFGHLIIASDFAARNFTFNEWVEFLDMLQSAGADAVNLYIVKSVYEERKKDYDRLIEEIKRRGLKLSLRPYVHYNLGESFKSYFKRLRDFKLELLKKYNPDFLLVANEPAFLGSQKRGRAVKVDLKELKKYLENVTAEAKRIKKDVITFVTLNKDADISKVPEIVEVVSSVKDLDVVAFNIYGAGNMEVVEDAIEKVRKRGKDVWIYETWFAAQPLQERTNEFLMFRDCRLQGAICGWLKYISSLKRKWKVKGSMPFFTEQFMWCNGRDFSEKRTPSFFCFKAS